MAATGWLPLPECLSPSSHPGPLLSSTDTDRGLHTMLIFIGKTFKYKISFGEGNNKQCPFWAIFWPSLTPLLPKTNNNLDCHQANLTTDTSYFNHYQTSVSKLACSGCFEYRLSCFQKGVCGGGELFFGELLVAIFNGTESDHWLCLSLTD